MATIIQLAFDQEYDKLWWVDQHRWDTRTDDGMEEPNTVYRPVEIAAFRRMYRQARYFKKRGLFINLTSLHIQAMTLEYQALSKAPTPDNVNAWIADRMFGVMPNQVRALLDEASLAAMLREVLGLQPLVIDWQVGTVQRGKRAA